MKNKVWIASGLAFSIITSTLAATASFIGSSSIAAPNAQPWGAWSPIVFCPPGSYVNGYSMRVEAPQGRGDDTALNAITLYCYNRAGNMVGWIRPHPGIWGNWGPVANCPVGTYANGFQLKVEGFQGSGDDTGANSLKFRCSDGYSMIEAPGGGPWGNWSSLLEVAHSGALPRPQIWAICGVRAKFENHVGGRDDTALNNLEFYWCGS